MPSMDSDAESADSAETATWPPLVWPPETEAARRAGAAAEASKGNERERDIPGAEAIRIQDTAQRRHRLHHAFSA